MGIVENIESASLEERLRLEERLLSAVNGAPAGSTIPRRDLRIPCPLSFAQQRLWFLDKLEPGHVYNVAWGMHLSGELDADALRKALNAVIARHEVLRTRFPSTNGAPIQSIAEQVSIEMPTIDLRDWPDAAREPELQRILGEEAKRPFDLSRDLLVRAKLLRTGEREHVWLLVMHHIVCDGWSRAILVRELAGFYEAYQAGKCCALPDLPVQYADFAVWQRQFLQGDVLRKQLAHWRQQLEGALPVLDLPTDRQRPAVQTFAGAHQEVRLGRELLEQLKMLGRHENATLFITLLAAFKTLLHRYSRQEDLVVGTLVAGRNRTATEPLIGFFVNTLPLRTDFSRDPTFRDLLRRVRETALGAMAHQDIPFEKLVEELSPERNLSHHPIFQVVFNLQNAPRESFRLAGLAARPMELNPAVAKFDLSLTLSERADGIAGGFTYRTDLFDRETIARMADHFETLLRGIVTNPDRRLSELPLLGAAEQQRTLVDWNATETPSPPVTTIHELFEIQAARTPDAVAVECQGAALTYRELSERSSQLAHFLRKLGVRPETPVAICLDRSLDLVVGLLGILKAGGAYVPLDPAYPTERLSLILEDSRAPVLVTNRALSDRVERSDIRRAGLDDDGAEISRQDRQAPLSGAGGTNLAYVLFTSGSAGRPKGVAIEHRNAVAFLDWSRRSFSRDELAGVLASTSISFDLSVFELFVPLTVGGKCIIAENALHLPRLPATSNVTLLNSVPSALAELLRAGGIPPSLRTINLAGEPLTAALAAQIHELPRIDRLYNLYGPTETTTYSTMALVPTGSPTAPTIGRPIANTRVFVLDKKLQPVPIGVPGELHIGGLGVSRGYFGRPELTAERFIPDPFGGQRGGRLYKTGDLVRWQPTGELEFLGRLDHQVKVRGFRIELGEVEHWLVNHSSVQDAVALVREDRPGNKQLVAYVVPSIPAENLERELLRHLADHLPHFMLPAAVVVLERFPLTPNGKVDRHQLPAPAAPSRKDEVGSSRMRTALELQLTYLWEEVLGQKNVGLRDDFFELGGHSLLAAQLLDRIEKVLGQNVPLRALFQAPTVEGMVKYLGKREEAHTWPTLVPIRTRGSLRPLFGVAKPNANPLGFAFLARHLDRDQPLYVLQSPYRDENQAYSQAEFAALAEVYVKAMREVQPAGPYQLAGFCEGAQVAFEMARQLEDAGQQVALLAVFDAWPVENTRSYFRWHVFTFLKALRRLRALSWREKSRLAMDQLGRLGRRLGRLGRKKGPTLPSGDADTFKQRYWPGKDFVPQVIDARIKLFRVRKQPFWRIRDPKLGWSCWTRGGVDAQMVAGDHMTLLREPFVKGLAEKLMACIHEVNSSPPHESLARPMPNGRPADASITQHNGIAQPTASAGRTF
jgi:amino acid adenylation domain-containing protein